jgi:hypothetical protein
VRAEIGNPALPSGVPQFDIYSPISRTVSVFVVEFPLLSVTVRSKM